MKTSDKLISAIILGVPAPVFLALLLWWGGYIIDRNLDAGFIFLITAGIAAGIILNALVLRRFIFGLFKLPHAALFAIEIFYSVIIYGFFMGFPVFNSLVCIAGSYIVIRKSIVNNDSADTIRSNFKKASFFSFFLLLLLCVCTAILALGESSIRSQVQSMLGLPFNVEMWMIWLLITGGGVFLLAFQYLISKFVFKSMLRRAGKACEIFGQ